MGWREEQRLEGVREVTEQVTGRSILGRSSSSAEALEPEHIC